MDKNYVFVEDTQRLANQKMYEFLKDKDPSKYTVRNTHHLVKYNGDNYYFLSVLLYLEWCLGKTYYLWRGSLGYKLCRSGWPFRQ